LLTTNRRSTEDHKSGKTLLPQLKRVSVIVPLGPEEDLVGTLLDDVRKLPRTSELLLVYSTAGIAENAGSLQYSGPADALSGQMLSIKFKPLMKVWDQVRKLGGMRLKLITSRPGRAAALNAGAEYANGDFFWFLHADSRFGKATLKTLNAALTARPEALHFFRLSFMDDGRSAMIRLNQWGARIRSEFFKVPFGDQGFCISRENFHRIGGFPETVSYGEDHLFLWKARQLGIDPVCTGSELYTSARKYDQAGWGRLTLKYQYFWLKQALPEYVTLLFRNFQQ